MNQEQPKSVYDAPEPPWHLKPILKQEASEEFKDHEQPTAEHPATDIHPDDKSVELVKDEDTNTAIPMGDEEDDEPIEMPEAA